MQRRSFLKALAAGALGLLGFKAAVPAPAAERSRTEPTCCPGCGACTWFWVLEKQCWSHTPVCIVCGRLQPERPGVPLITTTCNPGVATATTTASPVTFTAAEMAVLTPNEVRALRGRPSYRPDAGDPLRPDGLT